MKDPFDYFTHERDETEKSAKEATDDKWNTGEIEAHQPDPNGEELLIMVNGNVDAWISAANPTEVRP